MLKDLNLKQVYYSDSDDIVKEFYIPVLKAANRYDRLAGFFSSSSFALAAEGIQAFIQNGAKFRLICGAKVSEDDYNAIASGLDKAQEIIDSFDVFSNPTDIQRSYIKLLAYLVADGRLEIKFAFTPNNIGIFHEKVGIIGDLSSNEVCFYGSNNETAHGWMYNIESFNVFRSWQEGERAYLEHSKKRFDSLWSASTEGVRVVNAPKAFTDQLIKIRPDKNEVADLTAEIEKFENSRKQKQSQSRNLREYQTEAITHWVDHEYQSIFEMATGTGKTFTAINALKKFQNNNSYLRAIVVVPLRTLTIQWEDDLKKILPDTTIINTSTNSKWKEELSNITLSAKLGHSTNLILVTTYSMFAKPEFGERIAKLGDDNILLADEMHNLVNKNRIAALANPAYKYKLGLSATPTRLWKQEESAFAQQYFGSNSYQYSLADAIKNEFLVPYNYHPLLVHLDTDEYEEYLNISREIARLSQFKSKDSEDNPALNMKLIARARIKKNAQNKILSLENTLSTLQRSNNLYDALVYVDNEEFLVEIQKMLTGNNIRTTKFIGSSSLEERLAAIDNLRSHSINAIVAIKCLDEGVDIPSAKKAFFISNNTDPREYVQRLGRVLRLDEASGKTHADIYDYIVVPPTGIAYEDETDRRIARNMIKNELIRAHFFNELALNSDKAQEGIDDGVNQFGFYFEEDELVYKQGDEDNEPAY